MSNQTNFNDQELNLSELKTRMNSGIDQLGWLVFRGIRFLIRNAIYLIVLFAVGVGLGIYMDLSSKTYENQVMVIPNFGSADYLYSQIDLIESKMKQNDSVFLKKAGFKNPKQLLSIKIEPVIEIFPMIQRDKSNMELFKLLAENGDINKVIEEPITSMNYKFHKITIGTKLKASDDNLVKPLLNFLNSNVYYSKIRDQYLKNLEMRVSANERTIVQINGVLDMFATFDNSGKGSNMVYYNNQLNEVIKSKEELVEETGNLKIEQKTSDHFIKESSTTLNVQKSSSIIAGKMKLIIPILLIFIFVLLKLSIRFYKKYSLRNNS